MDYMQDMKNEQEILDIIRKIGDDEVCTDCLASNMMLPNCLECEHYKEIKSNE